MKVEPYLFFNGHCEEAIAFYKQALDAEVVFQMRMNESPTPPAPGTLPPGSDNKIMHASLRIGDSLVMVSDGNADMQPSFKGICLSLRAADAAEAERVFGALAAGGKITVPLAPTFWSPCFGMLEDRFGVGWMVMATA